MKRLSFSLFLGCVFSLATAQTAHYYLRQADDYYEYEEYQRAEESYRKANEQKATIQSRFNLGNSLYQQDRYEEAIAYFEEAANSTGTNKERANAFYNLGNTHLRNQDIESSIDAYKESLRLDPTDYEAKRNLYLAKLMQEQQQQEQEQQKQQEQEQSGPSEDENSDNEQNEENQEQESDDDQNASEQGEESESSEVNEEDEATAEKQELSKEDAEKLLGVIEGEEKKVQEKLRKISGDRKKPEKDW